MNTKTLQYQCRLWTLLLIIVPSLLVMIIYTQGQIKISKENSLQLISMRVASQERLIQRWMSERTDTLHKITQLEAFKTLHTKEMQHILYVIQEGNNNFDGLVYIDKQGIFKLSTFSSPTLIGTPYTGNHTLTTDSISDVFLGKVTRTPLINFSSPIFDYEGNFQGVILGSVKTKNIITLLRDNQIGATGEVLLVNREGLFLSEPRNVPFLIQKGLIETTAVMNLTIPDDALRTIRLGESGIATWTDYTGKNVLSAYQDMPGHRWTLIGKINEEEVFAPIYQQLTMMTLGTLLMILLLVPLSTLLTNRIKRPIDWLVGQSTLIATKNHELVGLGMRTTYLPRELLMLCQSFVKLSHKIQNSIRLLHENEIKLENKVSERTKTLSTLNIILREGINKHQAMNSVLENSQLALTVSETRYKNLFYHMHAGFSYYKVILDHEQIPIDLECITVNPAYEKHVDRPACQLIGQLLTTLAPNTFEKKTNWLKIYMDVAITRKPARFTQHFGQRCYSISAYSPVPGYVAVISEDMTEYLSLKQEAARMSRLNLIENMAAGLAHEIRNPLTVVKGYLQYFKKKIPDNLHEQLDLMLSELARIETIITDFLSIAKNKPTALAKQDLNLIIHSLSPLLLANAQKRGMKIEFKLCPELPYCLLAEKEIKQLILNLVMNGLDAMTEQDNLIIETKYHDNRVVLCITDSGSGIPQEVQQKIFDPFFTTKDEGTGLGLSVCASIIERHHGTIKISSTEGTGTSFTITFHDKEIPPLHTIALLQSE